PGRIAAAARRRTWTPMSAVSGSRGGAKTWKTRCAARPRCSRRRRASAPPRHSRKRASCERLPLLPRPAARGPRRPQRRQGDRRRHTLRVDGEYVTYEQIAKRMGYSEATANRKVRACLRAKVKITWEALK